MSILKGGGGEGQKQKNPPNFLTVVQGRHEWQNGGWGEKAKNRKPP